MAHPTFFNVVNLAWANANDEYNRAIPIFFERVKFWNLHVSGNVFYWEKFVLARLKASQKAFSIHPNNVLLNLEKNLMEEFNSILDQEQQLRALKSRVSYLLDGDKNTKFFHVFTLVRRHSNKILRIKINNDDWISDPSEIGGSILDYFAMLFHSYHISSLEVVEFLPPFTVMLQEFDVNLLVASVEDEEIRQALFLIKPFIAPCSDGLHAGFYHHCWESVRPSFTQEVQNIFNSCYFPEGYNNTLITLIPNCISSEFISQFHPISLCNTIYKIVTKVLVARLRQVLSPLISPMQIAFVLGRRGIDNVIIIQELIHSLACKKGKMGGMAIKINLEKAYDRMELGFVRVVLHHFGFPNMFIKLVMECIYSTSTSILFKWRSH